MQPSAILSWLVTAFVANPTYLQFASIRGTCLQKAKTHLDLLLLADSAVEGFHDEHASVLCRLSPVEAEACFVHPCTSLHS